MGLFGLCSETMKWQVNFLRPCMNLCLKHDKQAMSGSLLYLGFQNLAEDSSGCFGVGLGALVFVVFVVFVVGFFCSGCHSFTLLLLYCLAGDGSASGAVAMSALIMTTIGDSLLPPVSLNYIQYIHASKLQDFCNI